MAAIANQTSTSFKYPLCLQLELLVAKELQATRRWSIKVLDQRREARG